LETEGVQRIAKVITAVRSQAPTANWQSCHLFFQVETRTVSHRCFSPTFVAPSNFFEVTIASWKLKKNWKEGWQW